MKRNAMQGLRWYLALIIWCFFSAYIAEILRVCFDCEGTRLHIGDTIVLLLLGTSALEYGLLLFAGLSIVILVLERFRKRRVMGFGLFALPPIICATVLLSSLAFIPPRAYICILP